MSRISLDVRCVLLSVLSLVAASILAFVGPTRHGMWGGHYQYWWLAFSIVAIVHIGYLRRKYGAQGYPGTLVGLLIWAAFNVLIATLAALSGIAWLVFIVGVSSWGSVSMLTVGKEWAAARDRAEQASTTAVGPE